MSGGTAQASTTSLSVGSHTVSAQYSGNTSFNSSSGSLSGGQTVNKADTTTGVTSSLNPSAFGQNVTFTATVTPGSGSGPGGTVQFVMDGSNFGAGCYPEWRHGSNQHVVTKCIGQPAYRERDLQRRW